MLFTNTQINMYFMPLFNKDLSSIADKSFNIMRISKGFLEAKASKGMHQVCIEKSPDRHLSIHPC